MGTIDRISELPVFILHNILSNLDTKEAGRVSVLSKRWYEAWSSVPVLNFRHEYYRKKFRFDSMKYYFSVDKNAIPRFLKFIDRTMHRYDTHKYRIRKFNLELPIMDKKIQPLVDKWIKIAVQNQVEELCINSNDPRYSYTLPEILFRAKSLKVLKCSHVVLPYYETMELISLEYLDLSLFQDVATVDTDMLQRIIAFCPLVEFNTLTGPKLILLSWKRKVNKEDDVFGKFKASSLRKFTYHVFNKVVERPLDMKLVALKNLRKVEISSATITDDIVSELVSGLVALESLVLSSCVLLKCIMISSISLKEL
ncbi:F-box/FBD/LRR-repeat protein At5g56420-like [Silene latifolia]|uniref:F-box/FBD/LRR-repeat protein At5g56420-like n=1 Tax=Silene latifolia TaxID=37657 RepID=UPI003D78904A